MGLTWGGLPITNGKVGRRKSEFAVIGFPSDLGASTAGGQARGVAAVFAASDADRTGYTACCGAVEPSVRDNDRYVGSDVHLAVQDASEATGCVVAVGGDDSITYGVVTGLLNQYPNLGVLHYDAHSDLMDGYTLDHSNWVTFTRRSNIPVQQWGQRVMGDTPSVHDDIDGRPVLVAIDMDVVDPAYAPGVAVPYPFGCTPSELFDRISNDIAGRRVVGISLTEIAEQGPYNAQGTGHLGAVLLAKVMDRVHTGA